MRLKDKVVVVTAAGQGIGLASVLRMAREGAKVFATDIRDDLLIQLMEIATRENLDISVKKVDVTEKSDIEALAAELEKVDVLFNCAGFVHQGSIFECSDQMFDLSYNINVRGMFWMCQNLVPKIPDGGSVINMSSVASSIKGAPNRVSMSETPHFDSPHQLRCVKLREKLLLHYYRFAYGTTKAAVIGLTKSLAADLVSRKVRVNAICPGTVETPSWHQRVNESADPEQAKKDFVARQKMERLGTAEEIAALVSYLASDESAYTTAVAHVIDGGWSI